MNIHDTLALRAARTVVERVNQRDPQWVQIFVGAVALKYHRAASRWPLPDAVVVEEDEGQEVTRCALEFKPPASTKTECVRGLGQSLTYLKDHDCSALILPDRASDGFDIADYFRSLLSSPPVEQQRIGVYAYSAELTDPTDNGLVDLRLLKPIGALAPGGSLTTRARLERTFWAYYRDFSLEEFMIALTAADRADRDATPRDIGLSAAFATYLRGETTDSQGIVRTRTNITESHFKGNMSVFLAHVGFWNPEGIPTDSGRHIVHLSRVYGLNSQPVRNYFASRVLIDGKHFDLIRLVDDFQRRTRGQFEHADDFFRGLEDDMENEGLLQRLPNRRRGGGRRFFKAELTLWGRMLRIIRLSGRSYYVRGLGLDFDWPRIAGLLRG